MTRHSNKSLCLVVYKIEKDIGSEDGVGYDISLRLVQDYQHVTLISRVNNIEKLKNDPQFEGVTLIGIDVPRALGWFKRKGRGIILYYYLWQVFVGKHVQKLNKSTSFNLIYQLNFHTDWAPHFLKNPYGKIAWGPLVHHPRVRDSYLCRLSFWQRQRTRIAEWSKQCVKNVFWNFDFNIPKAIKRTDSIIYGNPFWAAPYAKRSEKIHTFPYGASVFENNDTPEYPKQFNVLFSGRLIPLKNPTAVLDGFIRFSQLSDVNPIEINLTFLGDGIQRNYIEEQIRKYSMGERIHLPGKIPQPQLKKHYQEAAVFLFPSFESQSLVTAEAMAYGTIPICHKDTGPAFVAQDSAIIIESDDYDSLVDNVTEALNTLYQKWKYQSDDFEIMMLKTHSRYLNHLTFNAVYDNIDKAIWS